MSASSPFRLPSEPKTRIEALLARALSAKEEKSLAILRFLVERGGGQLRDGLFVSRPGVELLAETEWLLAPRADSFAEQTSVTFLLAGISVETTLELVAHGGEVARLTTSKTQAMDVPLFRVEGPSADAQVRYLERMLRERAAFEKEHDPRNAWEDGTELFNRLQSGCKATALALTMPLSQYHHVFLGRIPADGNEREVREVCGRMAELLHARYPEWILEPSRYAEIGAAGRFGGAKRAGGEAKAGAGGDSAALQLAARTRLAKPAAGLFEALHIDRSQPEDDQLLEFRSRMTYLSFRERPGDSAAFNRRMVRELHHISVAAATSATVRIAGVSPALAERLRATGKARIRGEGPAHEAEWTESLRGFHRFFRAAAAALPDSAETVEIEALHAFLRERFPLVIE